MPAALTGLLRDEDDLRVNPDASESGDLTDFREEWTGPAPAAPRAAATPTRIAPQQPLPTRGSASTAPSAPELPKNTVHGVARDVNLRNDSQNQQPTMTFRIDRYDVTGDRLAPVAVALARYRGGVVSDGDEVEVTGRWSHGTLRATRVRNLTTSSDVRGWFNGKTRYIIWIVALLILIAVAIVIVMIATYKPAQP